MSLVIFFLTSQEKLNDLDHTNLIFEIPGIIFDIAILSTLKRITVDLLASTNAIFKGFFNRSFFERKIRILYPRIYTSYTAKTLHTINFSKYQLLNKILSKLELARRETLDHFSWNYSLYTL